MQAPGAALYVSWTVNGGMYLGIDIGTSAVKICAMARDGSLSASAAAAIETHHPSAGASEQAATDWWDAIRSAMVELLTRIDPGAVRGLGLSGQMHGTVLLDADRRLLRPVMLWNDSRAAAECRSLTDRVPEIARLTGMTPMPGFAAPKLLWLKTHEPEIHARIAHVLLPKDYVGMRLHGGLVTDPSDAAGTGWLDQGRVDWDADVCAASATAVSWLPEIRPGTRVAGSLTPAAAEALGLAPGLPVAVGAGDAAAGAAGIGAIRDGDGFLSLGTSGQIFVTTSGYRPAPEVQVHAYAHTLPDLWFQMAAMLNGARPMAWLAGILNRPVAELLSAAEVARPGPVFLPYLTGERTPHGDSDIRAGFWGLGEADDAGTMMRAVVEAIAFSFADAARALALAGTRPAELLAVGGGARSDFLLQMIADLLELPVGRCDGAEIGPALGAARLAQVAAGDGTPDTVMTRPEAGARFLPAPGGAEALADRLAVYRALYPAMKAASQASSRC